MEIKIKIPDFQTSFKKLKKKIIFFYWNIKHKITRYIENKNKKLERQYKDLILNKLTNETFIRYFFRCKFRRRKFLIVEFYLYDKRLVLFRYNRLTKRLHIYSDKIMNIILIERNIYLDEQTGLITVKTEKGIKTSKLSAYSYSRPSLTLYFGPFQYKTIIPTDDETHQYLFSTLNKIINQK